MEALVCKKITKQYKKGKKALDGLSFTVPCKGIFALIGRNGAGKTTLIRILSTQLMPTSGSATLNGLDIVKDVTKLRKEIAVLPQEARAVNWMTPKQTILSYLMFRGMDYSVAKKKAEQAIKEIQLEAFADKLNSTLSGGMKRKVLVASILASGAEIIFVDEPTTGLDPISRAELWEVFKKLKKDHFVFLTTHYLEEAEKLADKIGIIDNGKLMGLGTLEEIRKLVKYQYSIKVLEKGRKVKIKQGEEVIGEDGFAQIMTTEKEADRLSSWFIKEGIRFSINPISLDDIFYYVVKKPIENKEEEEDEDEGWY